MHEDNENSIDLVPGETYEIFISYFLYKTNTSISLVKSFVKGEEAPGAGNKPLFKKLILNKLEGTYDPATFYEVKSGATYKYVSWALVIASTILSL